MEFPSVNPLVIKKYYYWGIYRWNEAGNFIFYYRRPKNYWWKIHRQSIFVGDFIGKLIYVSYANEKISFVKLLNFVVLNAHGVEKKI